MDNLIHTKGVEQSSTEGSGAAPACPALPAWAYVSYSHKGCVMVRGDDLQPGDTIYFRDGAYGRELFVKQSATRWSAMVLKPDNHYHGEVTINLDTWYVTRRAAQIAPAQPDPDSITHLRVDCDDLAVGDIVMLGPADRPYRAMIASIGDPDASLRLRPGTINTTSELKPYRFFRYGTHFTVVGGPKLARANADPALVQQRPNGVFWRGG